ncbi:hypothetical protein D3C79_749330 [compost metagenome]
MQGRADRRRLAHCTVAVILAAQLHRGEQQRDRRTGQQVVDGQRCGYADTPVAQPGLDGATALVEGHRLARLVAKGGHCHGAQLLGGQGVADAIQVQVRLQQAAQRAAVEQRHGGLAAQPQQAVADEAAGLAHDPGPVAADDQMAAKILPEGSEPLHGLVEVHGTTGQGDGVDGPGGGADNDRERVVRAGGQQLGDARQHADLVGSAGAAARKDETGYRGWSHGVLPGVKVLSCPASSRVNPLPQGPAICRTLGNPAGAGLPAKRPGLLTRFSAFSCHTAAAPLRAAT